MTRGEITYQERPSTDENMTTNCAGQALGAGKYLIPEDVGNEFNRLLQERKLFPVYGTPKPGDFVVYGTFDQTKIDYFHHIGVVQTGGNSPIIQSKLGYIPGIFNHQPNALPDQGSYSQFLTHQYYRVQR